MYVFNSFHPILCPTQHHHIIEQHPLLSTASFLNIRVDFQLHVRCHHRCLFVWHCKQTGPNLKLLLFDFQCAKRPVITKLSLPIHFKVQSSTECPCLRSTGLHLYRFSLSRDTKDDHVQEGRDKPLSHGDSKTKLWKGFQTKVLLYRAWVTGATMKQLMKLIRT